MSRLSEDYQTLSEVGELYLTKADNADGFAWAPVPSPAIIGTWSGFLVGEIRLWASDVIPPMFVLADGAPYSIASEIGQVLLASGQPDNGDGTVNMWILDGVFPMFALLSTPLLSTGGAASVTLTEGQLARHSHVLAEVWDGGTAQQNYNGILNTVKDNENPTSFHISEAGNDEPHENRPPFVVLRPIVFIGD